MLLVHTAGIHPFNAHILTSRPVDASGGVFQIRPHKEFVPSKGRERLLSLRLLSELPQDDGDLPASSEIGSSSSNSDTRNAYDFMRRRHAVTGGDPTMKRWNASIRLSNFTSVDSSPLCVRKSFQIRSLSYYLHRLPRLAHYWITLSESGP
jgi:DNA mismatch repair protein MSH5